MPEHAYEARIAGTGNRFPVRAGERILAAARRAGIWLPFECGWGSCGTCKLTVVEGQAETLFSDAPAITPRDVRRHRVLACQATAGSDLVLKAPWISDEARTELPTADYSGELAEVEELGPDIRRFRFGLDGPAEFNEGQHAILDIAADVRRCYSMSNLAGAPVVEFVAKCYGGGLGSEQLFSLPVGARVPIELPYGEMWVREESQSISLIAGGTGIAPILAILRRMSVTGEQRPVNVFYGAGRGSELVCWSELESLVKLLPDARLHGALLHPVADWSGTIGFVTDAIVNNFGWIADSDFYVAGPPPMVDAVLKLLSGRDVQLDRIHYDSFG